MRTIVLTGGGTAGHVIPNLALVPYLKKHFDKIHYIGGTGIEEKLVSPTDIPFHKTTVVKFDRGELFANFKIPLFLIKGIKEAIMILKEISPNVVFSKGGYASLPTCFAAKKLDIPVVCHESDITMGLANKLVSRFADITLTSFPETPGGILVGNPIRKEFSETKAVINDKYKTSREKPLVLIFGGSQGSKAINDTVYKALPVLLKDFNVVHISGKSGNMSINYPNYLQIEYTNDLPELMKKAEIIICRSGSNTLFEVASLGKKCITIPLPKGVSRGDQFLNAKSFEKSGYCDILAQEQLSPTTLLEKIESIRYKTPPTMNVLQINENIVKHIVSVTQ